MNIYIHIPFCHRKCHYCYYYSFVPGKRTVVDEYLSALEREFFLRNKKTNLRSLGPVDTVYIGGGTPNYLSDAQLDRLFLILNTYLDLTTVKESVVELNPAACSRSQLEILKKHGITRLSFGIQTVNADILEAINRHHVPDPENIIRTASGMGFVVNLDFMLGLPGQTMDDVEKAIRLVKELKPESSFWCELRCGTEQIGAFSNIPSHEEVVAMYELVTQELALSGYRQIIPEYFTTKRSMPLYLETWWTARRSLGFGLSAFSASGDVFSKNTDSLTEYVATLGRGERPLRYVYRLDREEMALVRLVSALKEGRADLGRIRRESGVDLEKKLERELSAAVLAGLITLKKGKLAFTERGFTISSPVANGLLRNSDYLVRIMDTAFNFIDTMPDLESFIRRHFVIRDEGDETSVVFVSPNGNGVGILKTYAKE
ncbi:MAG: coproporphyrinogen-III oxidase family protein [Candidatus Moraniibacteriota bacterium]